MRRFYHYGSQTVLFFGEIFVPGLSVPYLTICQLSHFPSQRRPFHKIDFFYLLQSSVHPTSILSKVKIGRIIRKLKLFSFRENMAACVTALKRSHDLENYGFDGLR